MTAGSGIAGERAVSVIVPCFNAEDFVESAVERLLLQSDVDIQIVIVDDGSSDGTAAIAARLAEAHSEVAFVALPRNQGVAAARRAAVTAASADYVWFVDADDEWAPDAARAMLTAAIEHDADVVCAKATVVAEQRGPKPVGALPAVATTSGAAAFRMLLTGELTGHLWNKLFRRDLLDRIEFTPIRQHSDQAMVAQALSRATTVAYLPKEVYTYRLRTGSIIRSGARRADSLRTLGTVVGRCMAAIDATALRSTEYLYYRARYGALARLKDATSGAYLARDAEALVREVRGDMSIAQWWALVRRRDATRIALYTLGWASPNAYARTLDRFGGRL
ncbi:glycosyltransferase family 2 protein [Microbacterium sp. CFBP9034]|uniref:glycosyltransferase family 2 protein n=1 Tax=Microbacterium sp. CFBP9034 TaxID=3096540 RepID=UPI002A6A80AF|nr:glycosyltransferase family 2 protein [Microbacterium sp. CFBP9034]MDY0910382.1 glycosyltransferase family 2 protein [Microbacterium sp. CFBP9034]